VNLTAISLFAGIEGIGLALHRAGIAVKAAVEIDDAARGVIADHFPDTALMTDVTGVSADDLLAAGFVPERGLVAAGWPCQGNSVAGRRGGMADPRSGLWVHVARLLAELRPRWFLGENVPGLLSVNDGRDFATVVDDLAHLGYGFCWRVLDAQHFGVPQRRRRVFIVGCAGDRAAPVQVLLEPESSGGHSAPRPAAGTDVAGTLGSRAGGSRTTDLDGHGAYVPFAVHENQRGEITTSRTAGSLKTGGGKPGQGYPAIVETLRSHPRPGSNSTGAIVTHALTAEGADASEDGAGRGTPLVTHALTTRIGAAEEDGTGRGSPLVSYALGSHSGSNGEASNLSHSNGGPVGTGISEETAYSLRAERTQSVANAAAVRRLTPLECERLQGFPDHWTATSNGRPQSDSARYRQLGNAVAVPVVEWIARRIAAVHGAA
jgi:DNA (cytosine-5)-methyltransferase 1